MTAFLLSALLFISQSPRAGEPRDPLRFRPDCAALARADTAGWSTQSFEELLIQLPPGRWQTTPLDFFRLGGQEWVDGPIKVFVDLRVAVVSDLRFPPLQRSCRTNTAAGPVLLVETVTDDRASVSAWNPALSVRQLDAYVVAQGPPSELPKLRAIVLSARGGGRSTLSCIPFSVDKLSAGEDWRFPIQQGLEVRINGVDDIWMIDIGPRGETTEHYEYPVSPPFRSRSHAQIGNGYNTSTLESVSYGRFLRFVLTPAAFREASRIMWDVVDRKDWHTSMANLARGQFVLRFTGYEYRVDTDTLAWIAFEGSACVPTA